MISARTKAALAAAKARGVRLGGQRGSLERMGSMARKGNAASATVRRATVRRATAAKRNEDLLPVIEDIRAAGISTPQQIADGLNERGITAARGGAWSAVQVRRILESSIGQKANTQHVTEDGRGTIAA
jgi:DNA invertase Pin-like site-specific DNA recombinase